MCTTPHLLVCQWQLASLFAPLMALMLLCDVLCLLVFIWSTLKLLCVSDNTLDDHDSFWSSIGTGPGDDEHLLYRLKFPLCRLTHVDIMVRTIGALNSVHNPPAVHHTDRLGGDLILHCKHEA